MQYTLVYCHGGRGSCDTVARQTLWCDTVPRQTHSVMIGRKNRKSIATVICCILPQWYAIYCHGGRVATFPVTNNLHLSRSPTYLPANHHDHCRPLRSRCDKQSSPFSNQYCTDTVFANSQIVNLCSKKTALVILISSTWLHTDVIAYVWNYTIVTHQHKPLSSQKLINSLWTPSFKTFPPMCISNQGYLKPHCIDGTEDFYCNQNSHLIDKGESFWKAQKVHNGKESEP